MTEVGPKTKTGKNLLKKILEDTIKSFLKVRLKDEITAQISPINRVSKLQGKKNIVNNVPIFDKSCLIIRNNMGRSFSSQRAGTLYRIFWTKL